MTLFTCINVYGSLHDGDTKLYFIKCPRELVEGIEFMP